jgi:alkaline phosphatase D
MLGGMRITRRNLLLRATAAAVVLPACRRDPAGSDSDTVRADTDTGQPDSDTGWSWEPGPEPAAAWDPGGTPDAALAWGVQVGDVTETAAIVSVQTDATVAFRVARGTEAGWEELARTDDLAPVEGSAQVELTGLVPDTTYALVAESAAGRSAVTRFRTALYPGTKRVVTFGATSCLGGSDWPFPSLAHAAVEKLDFFVLLGDTVYADDGDGDVAWFRGFYREALTTHLQDVTATTSVVATWDDHEIDNDWSGPGDGETRQQAALTAFRAAIPQRLGETGKLWRKLSWGDCVDLFVLDCRGERDGDRYLSPEQMTWLQDALATSRARFKIVVNSVPITDWSDTVLWDFVQDDRWQGYPEDRDAILGWIRDQGIAGVLWITGDHHFGAITHVDPSGGAAESQYEVLCGPAGSSINAASYALPENSRYPSIVRTHNWVRFVCDPDAGTVQVSFVDGDGDVVSTLTLAV